MSRFTQLSSSPNSSVITASRKATIERRIAELREECELLEIELECAAAFQTQISVVINFTDQCVRSGENPGEIVQRHEDLIRIVRGFTSLLSVEVILTQP